jgi:hypothetical protein
MTKKEFVSDVILQLTQGAPSQDFQLDEEQVLFWGTTTLNDLKKREIELELRKGNVIPPIYITRQEGLTLTEEAIAEIDGKKQRMWLQLTDEIIDLAKDQGLIQIQDYDYNLVYKASLERLQMLNVMRFAKPSLNNLVYFRQGKKIFIEGIKTSEIDAALFIVDYIKKDDLTTYGDNDDLILSDQLIPLLIDNVVQKGKLQMYGTQVDMTNDGVDPKTPQYHTAISNPNQEQPTE